MKLEKRFQLAYLSLVVIGVGSWMFHMTLLYEYQVRIIFRLTSASTSFLPDTFRSHLHFKNYLLTIRLKLTQLMDEIPMFYELLIFVFILIEWGPERKVWLKHSLN